MLLHHMSFILILPSQMAQKMTSMSWYESLMILFPETESEILYSYITCHLDFVVKHAQKRFVYELLI